MKLRTVFASALLVATPIVAGCTAESAEVEEGVKDAVEDGPTLPERLVFMAGHVEAGIALYRAGESTAGGPHLLHPVSESYADEREGLDAIGFDPAPFEAVSAALEAGRPAAEIEPQLAAVEANLAEMRGKAGGEPADLIGYLMNMIAEEYAIGVTDGAVTDAGEYQDAWGFAKVARQLADDPGTPNAEAVRAEIDALIAMWPAGAPVPPADPASAEDVSAQVQKVLTTLGAV
ncbi:hypothetical protein [Erythrobacter sp. F6033]|uniref:hypothetical protein n=1 Tax=Erythrobacter sp. F6033 TaxID=2926401 RepID=UPI001FF38A92|nr:hypothetical protein [Erythrobacter sp. F6033]MCK0127688.1 hypothetical protein [Erythrobacter sp. F6033]